MTVKLDFNFYVSGLETAILDLLKNGNPQTDPPEAGMTGVKSFATYAGELDRNSLLAALQALAPRLPLVLASYGSGADKRKAATGMLENEPIENEHSCGFMVIVACSDLRGEKARKASAYKMVGEARQLLGGVQFEIEVEGEPEKILLNHSPFLFAGVETIARLKDLTAYAVHFTTTFKEWTKDRRVAIENVEEIELDIDPGDFPGDDPIPPIANDDLSLPGVEGEINES